jgi:hypothetical protein
MHPCASLRGSRGAQSGVRLCHCTDHVLRSAISHGFLADSQSSIAVPLGAHLEHGNGVLPSPEIWVNNIVFQAERNPMGTMVLHCIGTLCSMASLDPFVDSAQVKAECMGVRKWESCKGSI